MVVVMMVVMMICRLWMILQVHVHIRVHGRKGADCDVTSFAFPPDGPTQVLLDPPQSSYTVPSGTLLPPVSCSADCNPACTYKWVKNDSPDATTTLRTLTLGQADPQTAGIYKCVASNPHGSANSKFDLTVQCRCLLESCQVERRLMGSGSFVSSSLLVPYPPRVLTFTWWGCFGLCQRHKPTELAHPFLFCSCVCFCLYGPFNCISFRKFSRQLSAFSLCFFPVVFLPYWSFQLLISLGKSPSALI